MAIFSAIAYAFAYAGSFLAAAAGIPFATAVQVGMIAGQVGSAIAALAIQKALTPDVNIPQQEIQAVINQTDAPRRVYVGQYLAGGIRGFFDVKNGMLYQLVIAAHGAITSFDRFWIDGEVVELDGVDVVNDPKEGFVFVSRKDGSAPGGDYDSLLTYFPGSWPASRLLMNQATFLVRSKAPDAEDFMKVFPKSYNTVYQWEIKGQAVYDPRTGATAYSDNAALVIAHYLTHPDGYRLAQDEVSWDSVAAMADWCDRRIPQKGGGTAPNMVLWGYWTLDEDPKQVLDRMKANSGIAVYEMADGRMGLIGGPFGQPSFTLTAADISDIQTSEAISEREGYNTLLLSHLHAGSKYEVVEVDAWRDQERLAQEGEITKELALEMCPSTSQCRRRGKMQIHDDNRQRIEVITNAVGLKARYPKQHGQRNIIALDYRPEDGSGRVIQGEYEVDDHEIDPKTLMCRIALKRIDRAAEEWDADAEEGAGPVGVIEAEADPAPAIEAVLTQRITDVTEASSIVSLEITALPVPDRNDLSVQARYRKVGATRWIAMQTTGMVAVSEPVEDGEQYEAQARFKGVFKGVDEWENLGPITVRVDQVAPGQPTDLFVSWSAGGVHTTWRNPQTKFHRIRLYRGGASSTFAQATIVDTTGGVPGQISELRDETAANGTSYRYWIVAANVSGLEGTPAGPAPISTPA